MEEGVLECGWLKISWFYQEVIIEWPLWHLEYPSCQVFRLLKHIFDVPKWLCATSVFFIPFSFLMSKSLNAMINDFTFWMVINNFTYFDTLWSAYSKNYLRFDDKDYKLGKFKIAVKILSILRESFTCFAILRKWNDEDIIKGKGIKYFPLVGRWSRSLLENPPHLPQLTAPTPWKDLFTTVLVSIVFLQN